MEENMNVYGLKCDSEDCNYTNMNVIFDDYPKYINKPCPKCGGNLLTQADYDELIGFIDKLAQLNEMIGPTDTNDAHVRMQFNLNGTGKIRLKSAELVNPNLSLEDEELDTGVSYSEEYGYDEDVPTDTQMALQDSVDGAITKAMRTIITEYNNAMRTDLNLKNGCMSDEIDMHFDIGVITRIREEIEEVLGLPDVY